MRILKLFAVALCYVGCAAITLQAQTNFASQAPTADESPIYTAKQVDKRVSITARPQASYTIEARKNDVAGTVTLRLVLHSSGKVTNIQVLKGLPNGLTEKAIAAAKQIKFTPAMKDGRPVSTYAVINYTFKLG